MMALVRDIDTGALNSAVNNTKNSNAALATAQEALTRTRQDKSLENLQGARKYQQEASERQAMADTFNMVLGTFQTAMNAGSEIYNIVRSNQIQTANNNSTVAINVGGQILSRSIFDGTTTFKENPDTGELEFSVAPSVQQWHDDYVKTIQESDMMASVKELALSSFEASCSNLIAKGFSEAITQAYTDLNDQFQSTLEQNLKNDVALVSSNGGSLGEGQVLSGIATIAGRSDWSTAKKEAKSFAYTQSVMSQAAVETASQIARTQGMKAAEEFIYSQPNLSIQDKQNAYSIANTALNQRASSLQTTASSYMEQALVDGTSTPDQIYASLASTFANEAPEVRDAVYSAARGKQSEIVQVMINNQFNSDVRDGLDSLQATLEDLEGGKYDAFFTEIPEKKAAMVSTYMAQIEKEEHNAATALATSQKNIEAADKNTLATFKKNLDSTKTLFDTGTIDGNTAVAMVTGYANETAKMISGVDTLGAMTAAAEQFLYTLADDYIPPAYQQDVKDGLSVIYASLGLNKTAGLSEEQQIQKIQLNSYTYGYIADLLFSAKNGEVKREDVLHAIQGIKRTIVYQGLSSEEKKMAQGTFVKDPEDTTYNSVFKKALDANDLLFSKEIGKYIMYDDDADAAKRSFADGISIPSYKFASDGWEQTWYNTCSVLRTQIAALCGVDENLIDFTPSRNDDGDFSAAPVFYARTDDGLRKFRFRGETIQEYSNGFWQKVAEADKHLDDISVVVSDMGETSTLVEAVKNGKNLTNFNTTDLNALYLEYSEKRDAMRSNPYRDGDGGPAQAEFDSVNTICKRLETEIGRRAMSKRGE